MKKYFVSIRDWENHTIAFKIAFISFSEDVIKFAKIIRKRMSDQIACKQPSRLSWAVFESVETDSLPIATSDNWK